MRSEVRAPFFERRHGWTSKLLQSGALPVRYSGTLVYVKEDVEAARKVIAAIHANVGSAGSIAPLASEH